MSNEIWVDTPFSANYQVSNFGRVKSKARRRDDNNCNLKEKILKARTTAWGYNAITFKVNNKIISYQLHRLVAVVFIPNPLNKREINHKDGNKLNNNASNLEWSTAGENLVHAYSNGLRKSNKNRKYKKHEKNNHSISLNY